jgi:hypothetical protein
MATARLNTPNNLPVDPALDQRELFQQGVRWIQQYSGRIWTDHNLHDPGIMLLEAACEAIADLSYRTLHPVEDLIQPDDAALVTPLEVLTCDPITELDLRSLLLLHHAQIENVWIAPKEDAPGAFSVKVQKSQETGDIKNAVYATLQSHRGLGQSFALDDISILTSETIHFCAEVDILADRQLDILQQQIKTAFEEYCSPKIRRAAVTDSRAELANQLGMSLDTELPGLINGPALDAELVNRHDLITRKPRTQVRLSDLLSLLMDLDGVLNVRRACIYRNPANSTCDGWVIDVSPECVPSIRFEENIRFYVAGKPVDIPTAAKQQNTAVVDDSKQQNAGVRWVPQGRQRWEKSSGELKIQDTLAEFFRNSLPQTSDNNPTTHFLASLNTAINTLFFELQKADSQLTLNQQATPATATSGASDTTRFLQHLRARFCDDFESYQPLSDPAAQSEPNGTLRDWLLLWQHRNHRLPGAAGEPAEKRLIWSLQQRLEAILHLRPAQATSPSIGKLELDPIGPPTQDVPDPEKYFALDDPLDPRINFKASGTDSDFKWRSDYRSIRIAVNLGFVPKEDNCEDQYKFRKQLIQLTSQLFAEELLLLDLTDVYCRALNSQSATPKPPEWLNQTLLYVLPAWAGRHVDTEHRRLVEQILRRETPAHLLTSIVWATYNDFKELRRLKKNFDRPTHSSPSVAVDQPAIELAKFLQDTLRSVFPLACLNRSAVLGRSQLTNPELLKPTPPTNGAGQ